MMAPRKRVEKIDIHRNARPGRSKFMRYLRFYANRMRSFLYFGIRYPWVRRRGFVRISWDVTLWSPHHDIEIGDLVQFGRGCIVHCDAKFGNKIIVANAVAFIGRDDHRYDVVGKTIWDSPRGDTGKVVVEDDVWIGHGACLVSGITIGKGSVVGAGSVVVKDVPPYAIVAGVPAKVVKKRFSEDEIALHEKLLGRA